MYSIGGVSFQKRKKITITNNSGGALTDYQVPITITYAAAMQAAFADIRFAYSDGTNIPYWLESKTDSTTAAVWIKVSLPLYGTSPAGDNIIYMYYGNASAASASNGTDTFMLFDDFSGTLDKWNLTQSTAGNIQIVSGRMRIIGNNNWITNGAVSKTPLIIPYILEYRNNVSDDSTTSFAGVYTGTLSDTQHGLTEYMASGVNNYAITRNGIGDYASGNGFYAKNTDYNMKMVIKSSGGYEVHRNTVLLHSNANSVTATYPEFSKYYNTGYYYVSNVRARKYAATEPTVTATGQEEHSRKGGILIY